MTPGTTAGLLIRPLDPRTIPLDLKGIYFWAILALIGIYIPIISENPLRVAFILPFILFIPGYLLIAALFPAKGDPGRIERIALSFGISLAIGPIARFQRRRHPEESRLVVPPGEHRISMQEEFSGDSTSRFDRVLSVVLIAAVLVAAATTVFIIAAPKEGEKFTEFYILGPRGKAADYPTEFMSGTPQTVIIGIGNHEYRDITYTVETFTVESRFNNATNQSTIVSAALLDRFSVTVPHNKTVEQPYSFRIMNPDTNRIEFLLFAEAPPDNIPKNNLSEAGYRNLHLWLRVH